MFTPEEFVQQNPDPEQPEEVPEPKPETPKPTPRAPERVAEESDTEETQRPGKVSIIIRPFGDVYLNGQRKASRTSQPYVEEVKPGAYTVRAVHPRFGRWEKRVSVRPGKTRDVLFNFNREYTLTVTSQPPNAEIIVDGKGTGRYTPSVIKVRPGQHSIRVRRRGFTAAGGAKQLTIDRDRKDPVHFTLRRNG